MHSTRGDECPPGLSQRGDPGHWRRAILRPHTKAGTVPIRIKTWGLTSYLSPIFILFLLSGCTAPQERHSSRAPLSPAPRAQEQTFKIVSWNVQTFGDVKPERQSACKIAYAAVISTNVDVIAIQEVANLKGMNIFRDLLPDSSETWQASFMDTSDSQDNALIFRIAAATITAEGFLFRDPSPGMPATSVVKHPTRWGHFKVKNFDFTLLSVHLTFKDGDAGAAAEELRAILDWLVEYFKDPANDPDVIIAGDFNLPSENGKPLSQRGRDSRWMTLESIIRAHGKLATGPNRLTVLVDEPTSRSKKRPANNYDHFIISQDVFEEFVSARRVPIEQVDSADRGIRPAVSDHYPIEGWFRSAGPNVMIDVR